MDNVFPLGDLAVVPGLADYLRNVIADGLGKTGSMHGNDLRIIYSKKIIESFQQVGLPAEYARPFSERTGASHYWFFVMTGQCTAMI